MKRFELFTENPQVIGSESVATFGECDNTQIRAQIADVLGRDLSRIVAAWSDLPAALKAAILAIVSSSTSSQEDEK